MVLAHILIAVHVHYEILKLLKRSRLKRGRERKNSSPLSLSKSKRLREMGGSVSLCCRWKAFVIRNNQLCIESLCRTSVARDIKFPVTRVVQLSLKRYRPQTKMKIRVTDGYLKLATCENKKLKAPFALVNRVLTPNQLLQAPVPPPFSAARLVSQFLSGPVYANVSPRPRKTGPRRFSLV